MGDKSTGARALGRGLLTAALVVAGLGVTPLAHAADGLVWKWEPGVTRRYYLQADVQVPRAVPFNAVRNIDGIITAFTLTVLVDCTLRAPGKQASEVRCDIDRTSLQVSPVPSSAGRLGPVIEEHVTAFNAGWVDMTMSSTGRLRGVDLEGVTRDNARTNAIALVMREMVARAFAPLDLSLPKGGTDGGAQWLQSEAMAFGLAGSGSGTLSSLTMVEQVLATQDHVVTIGLEARGTVAQPDGGVNDSLGDTFNTVLSGSLVFDTQKSAAIQAFYQSTGTPTASSIASENGAGVSYVQTVIMQYVAPGAADPFMPTSAEVPPRRQ